jgi:arylsulfatase A-like enzyme
MKSLKISIVLGLTLLTLFGCKDGVRQGVNSSSQTQKFPNILLIISDDQAFGDLSLMDNPVAETPNLDRLAKEGFQAKRFYVSPVCAPTRASLLTGRYYQRMGVSGVTRGRENMSLEEVTMANILAQAGYQTGIFGKWHNGAHYPYHPLGRGFKEFVGFTSGHWSNYFDTTIEKNGSPFMANGYLPDVLTEESISFINRATEEGKPFFCYLSFPTPHTPLQVPDDYFDKYKAKGVDDFNATIYGMGENIDWNVGRILEELNRLKVDEETLVIYMSDNGPLNFRFNKGLKGRKGSVDEGGVRVPFLARWKGHIIQGKTSGVPLAHIDVLPTILDLIKISPEPEIEFDGLSFGPLLSEESSPESTFGINRTLFENWNGQKRALKGSTLLVDDQLFELNNDPSQNVSVRADHEPQYMELLQSFMNWEAECPKQINSYSIPVGHEDYPIAVLPAHEAILYPSFEFRKDRRHTGIAYHSQFGWAHDWIDYWTSEEAFPTWQLDVKASGIYEVSLKYALRKENEGCEMILQVDENEVIVDSLQVFQHTYKPSRDRVLREQEAPETDWATTSVGNVELNGGPASLSLRARQIVGGSAIELKEIILTKK